MWISVFSLFTEPGVPVMWWQQFVFLLTSVFSRDLLCVRLCVFPREHVRTPSPPSPVTLSAICWQPPCCFVYFTSPCICSICICMSKHTHTNTLMQFSLPSTSDDTFPFECYGCRLETQTHSQKWAFKVVSVCKRWRRIGYGRFSGAPCQSCWRAGE